MLLTTLVLLAGCERSDTQAPSAPGPVYRHAMDGAPGSLDPARASSIYANFLAVNLYDTLYRYRYLARPYELAPNLARDLPEVSENGLVYTIRLKPGTRFIDDPAFPGGAGREVTAHDFIYSIKRHFDPAALAQGAWLWQGRIRGLEEWKQAGSDYDQAVAGLRAVDDHTVRIELTAPFPQLTHTLAQGYAAIVPREAVEHYGPEFSNHPVGSGPFRLTSRDSARALLDRNPDYRREPFSLQDEGFDPTAQAGLGLERLEGRAPPFVDRLQFEFISEDAARWNALVSGEVQFIKVPVSQFDRVLASRNPPTLADEFSDQYRFEASRESGFVYTNFNLADPRIGYHPDPGEDARNRALRCAIVKAFDWQRRNDTFYYGIGTVFPGATPPIAIEFDPGQDHAYVQRDLDGARRLLAEHGWTSDNLPGLEYGFPSSVTERQMFEQFRSFMVELGFPREKVHPLTYATFADYHRAYSRREVMLVTSSWTMDYPDTENTLQLFYGPNGSPGSNSSNYNNPRYDELYRASAGMPPSPERTRLYQAMNRMIMEDCASITGIARTLLFLWDRNAVMLPDRSFVGGYFLRFVDVAPPASGG
jgi:ABC-type transport system substrate-binding protein